MNFRKARALSASRQKSTLWALKLVSPCPDSSSPGGRRYGSLRSETEGFITHCPASRGSPCLPSLAKMIPMDPRGHCVHSTFTLQLRNPEFRKPLIMQSANLPDLCSFQGHYINYTGKYANLPSAPKETLSLSSQVVATQTFLER